MSNTVPLGYKRVEYLESTGTQYIDTGIKPTISQKYEIKYSVSDITTNQVIFGTRTSGIFQTSTNQIYLNINDNKKRFFAGNIVTENGIQINIIQTDIFTANSGNYDSTGTKNFFIFVLNNIDTPSAFSTARIYSFKIYDNDILVRDYIPVLNENNEAGLYDLVNKEFYGNSGTGSFQYGDIIPEGTIAEKFSYSLEVKDLIKDGINYLGGNVTDETTLKEYRDELDSVYAKLPKTAYSEGSNITLSNTLKGKLDYEDDKVGYGDTKQESTNGYQLFDITRKVSESPGIVINNGFELTKVNNRIIRFRMLSKYSAGTYILSMKHISHVSSQTNYFYVTVQNYNNSEYSNVLSNKIINNSNSIILNITDEFDTLYFFIASNESDTAEVTVDDVMLESGTTAHDWEKYTGRNIKSKSKL